MRWNIPEPRIIVLAAAANDEAALDVPEEEYEGSVLALPKRVTDDNPIAAMGWREQAQRVEARLVRSKDGTIALLIDLNTAKEIDEIEGIVVFVTPECLTVED